MSLSWLLQWFSLPCATVQRPRRATIRLEVESLEQRWVPATVTNLNDSGTGSLRDAIAGTPAGGTVDFQPGLSGTITLASTLAIDHDLTIVGPGAAVITVSGNHAVEVFSIPGGVTAALNDLTVANGFTAA